MSLRRIVYLVDVSNNSIRTMVWAIDLDDGTMIEALGKGVKREKSLVVEPRKVVDCFGTGGKIKDEL